LYRDKVLSRSWWRQTNSGRNAVEQAHNKNPWSDLKAGSTLVFTKTPNVCTNLDDA